MKFLSLTTVVVGIFSGVLARSSVYLVSDQQHQQYETKQVSMNGFSLFYSHLMDTQGQPGLYLQQGAQEDAQSLLSNFKKNDLFERKVDANMMVIVAGVNEPNAILNQDASFYVTEDATEKFVNMVEKSLDETLENDNHGIVSIYKDQKAGIVEDKKVVPLSSSSSFDVESFKSHYYNRNTDLFDENNKVDRDFMNEIEAVQAFANVLAGSSDDKNALKRNIVDIELIEINTLQAIADEYGVESAQYKEATLILGDLFNEVVLPTFLRNYNTEQSILSTFIFTPPVSNARRVVHAQAQPNLLVMRPDSCYTTLRACNNGTNYCSNGNGECVEVKADCFSCQCKASNVGDSCQYIDSVADFQLLFWTGVFLIVTTAGVLTFVYSSGNIEHGAMLNSNSLPKQD